MEIFGVLFIFIVLAVVFRLIAGSFDGERVESYVRRNGWELVDKSWDPFGPGWFGEKDSRIYQIVYRDAHGNLHRAHVKTSMFSGVYLTNDHIVEQADAPPASRLESVQDENERLKARVRELEEGRAGPMDRESG